MRPFLGRALPTLGVYLVSACATPGASPAPNTIVMEAASPPLPADAARILQRVLGLDSLTSEVWPGFRLSDQVLILTDLQNQVTVVAGDTVRDGQYETWDVDPRIRVRRGPPPDSLLGMHLGHPWRGSPRAASVLEFHPSYRDDMISFIVHEAFHTHQHRRRHETGQAAGDPNFIQYSETDSVGIGLLAMESRALAGAIVETNASEAARHARTAIASREERCDGERAEICRRERYLEVQEGVPTFVTHGVVREPRSLPDSVSTRLTAVPTRDRLRRWHYYDSGMAWLTLLDRFGPSDWKMRVETEFPDRLLATSLRRAPGDSARDRALLHSPARRAAIAEAAAMLRADRAAALAAERAFWNQPGIPLRLYVRPAGGSMGVSHRSGRTPAGEPTVHERYGKEANTLDLIGESRTSGSGKVMMLPLEGAVGRVNGEVVSLSKPAAPRMGAVSIQSARMNLAFADAELITFGDSITVRAAIR